eukprot:scaffold17834_cov16-Tisochrysis_lutea.AAC.1
MKKEDILALLTYRAGRTARAGRSGRVFTLLRDEDVRHFKQMLRKADNTWSLCDSINGVLLLAAYLSFSNLCFKRSFVKNFKLAPGVADSFKPALEAALKQVGWLLLDYHVIIACCCARAHCDASKLAP